METIPLNQKYGPGSLASDKSVKDCNTIGRRYPLLFVAPTDVSTQIIKRLRAGGVEGWYMFLSGPGDPNKI